MSKSLRHENDDAADEDDDASDADLAERAAAAQDSDGEASDTDATEKVAPLTRRERHMKAADMFHQLDVKQRYVNTRDAGPLGTAAGSGQDDGEFLVKKRTLPALPRITTAPSATHASKPAGGGAVASRSGHEDSVAHGVASTDDDKAAVTASESRLTFDERLKGLSRHKRRDIVEVADLMRLKDLRLSKHTVFADDDDEDDGEVGAARSSARRATADDDEVHMAIAAAFQEKRDVTGNKSDEPRDADDEEEAPRDERSHAMALKRRVVANALEDKEQRKRILKKRAKGKDAPSSKADVVGDDDALQREGGEGTPDGSSGDDDDDRGQAARGGGTAGGLDDALLRAMRGELFPTAGGEKLQDELPDEPARRPARREEGKRPAAGRKRPRAAAASSR